jgi:hypothetical protein
MAQPFQARLPAVIAMKLTIHLIAGKYYAKNAQQCAALCLGQ